MSQRLPKKGRPLRELDGNGESVQDDRRRHDIRVRMQALEERVKNKANTLEFDSRPLLDCFEKLDDIAKTAKTPGDLLQNVGLLGTLSDKMLKAVKDLSQANGRSVKDFVSGLVRQFSIAGVGEREEEGMGPSEHSFDWARMGRDDGVRYLRPAVSFGTMLGPLSAEAPKGRARGGQKRPRDRVTGEKVSPDDADADPEGGDNPDALSKATTERTHKLRKQIKNGENGRTGIHVLPLIIDAHSFTNTVENVFALSFLVKEGQCKLTAAPEEVRGNLLHGIVAEHKLGTNEEDRPRGQVGCSQFILRLDYADWTKLRHCEQPRPSLQD